MKARRCGLHPRCQAFLLQGMQKLCKFISLLHPIANSAFDRPASHGTNNMPELNEVGYSESQSVIVIKEYFKFLTRMYLDETSVEWPPEGGWPMITEGAFGSLGKSDIVTSLLRQIPYLRDLDLPEWERPRGAPGADFCNWTKYAKGNEGLDPAKVYGLKMLTEGYVSFASTPFIIGLMEGGRDSPLVVLDTKYGIAYWPDCPDEIRHETRQEQVRDDYDYDSDAWASKVEADWRCDAPAWTILDFFAMLREQFEQLRFIPINSRQVIVSYPTYSDDGKMEPMLQKIYQEHGWPNLEHYRKEECIQAVEQALAEQYPHFQMD
jgi:hypothetical protein